MNTRTQSLMTAVALAGFLGACASAPPTHLVDVRNAYVASSNGLAGQLTPTELYDAKKVLDKANREFAENGNTAECRDYCYIAHRKVALADVKARTEQDRRTIAAAVSAGVVVRDAQVKNTQAALASTREQLKDERRDNSETAAQLESERLGRMSAEAKLAGAMKDLAAIAAVKEETRGLVITLSGSVLFASNQYALLNTAMTKLGQVAEALKAQDADKRMIVEGHTDSRGSDSINLPLSFNRANAVRDYLVSCGVDSEKISAVGMGSSRPIADNKSSENRANNRRVEIIISGSSLSSR